MPERRTRNLIRALVGTALCAAVIASPSAPAPEDLPAVAFQQAGLYRLEVALLVFYCGLLLITPAFSGLLHGRLPVEISVRGAKFEEKADHSVEAAEAQIEELEQRVTDLADGLSASYIEINQLKDR
ncbi:MAG: hypothetical protein M3Y75_11250 [Actinomycetota bacterium]|nr:hypothetical protein [Actinomycetota bacterium]